MRKGLATFLFLASTALASLLLDSDVREGVSSVFTAEPKLIACPYCPPNCMPHDSCWECG